MISVLIVFFVVYRVLNLKAFTWKSDCWPQWFIVKISQFFASWCYWLMWLMTWKRINKEHILNSAIWILVTYIHIVRTCVSGEVRVNFETIMLTRKDIEIFVQTIIFITLLVLLPYCDCVLYSVYNLLFKWNRLVN